MGNTILSIQNAKFYINNELVYSELPNANPNYHGLLMNARFVQGVFDDAHGHAQYHRFEKLFDPNVNTDELIEALPQWYAHGLRAFTVGIQGGGACFSIDSSTIENNPFGENGLSIQAEYLERLDRIIRAADAIGMVVIVSYFYGMQAKKLAGVQAHKNAVITASTFLREQAYTNVIIELANEYDIGAFDDSPVFRNTDLICQLLSLAKEYSGGMYVGVSGKGDEILPELCEASDVILIHANTLTRQALRNLIHKARAWQPEKPILCNEDSQRISNMKVCMREGVSWGYYNNMTKQEPPVYWGITKGEDAYYAWNLATDLGIEVPEPEQAYYLQGLEKYESLGDRRWVRIASQHPDTIDFVEFYQNGTHVYTCYDEPFTVFYDCQWRQNSIQSVTGDLWTAVVHMHGNQKIELKKIAE